MSDTTTNIKISYNYEEMSMILNMNPNDIKNNLAMEDYVGRLDVHDLVAKDDQYLSKMQDRNSAIKKCDWQIETCDDKRIDDFVQECLWKVLNNDLLMSIHEAVYKGFSVHEIIWNTKNQIEQIIEQPQRAFNFKKDGSLWIYDRQTNVYTPIPENKTIQAYAPIRLRKYPLGLSEALAPVICVKHSAYMKDWPHFNEFVAMPMLWAYYTEGKRPETITALKEMGKASIGAMPKGSELQFVEAKNSDPASFLEIINKAEESISKVVVGQTLTTSAGQTGSYSLGLVQSKVRDDILEMSLDVICNAINKYLVKPLIDFNFTNKKYPSFVLKLPTSKSAMAVEDKSIYDLGVRFTEDYFVEKYGLEKGKFKVVDGQPVSLPNSGSKKKSFYV